jgi:hypothetical protein
MTTITIDRSEILDLIACAQDYGFADDVLFSAFGEWIVYLSDDEISTFANGLLSIEGYGEEDVDIVMTRLVEWRDRYAPAGEGGDK